MLTYPCSAGPGIGDDCNPDSNATCLAEMTAFLTSPARRAAAVKELVAVANKEGFAGFNFDQENMMGSTAKPTPATFTNGWRAFLQELGAGMRAANPTNGVVSADICGCGGDIPLQRVSTVRDYMGMLPTDFAAAGVEAVSMCTYSNDSAHPYTAAGGETYNVFAERLACMSGSYGNRIGRIGLGQGIPTWNPRLSELRRQLSHLSAANLTKVAVFNVPSLYTSVEWLDVLFDWAAANKT